MKNINHLLQKYSKPYVPGEKRSKEYDNLIRRKATLQDNIQLLHQLNQELPDTLHLNKCDIQIIENLLKVLNGNLKTLNRRLNRQQLILIFIFYINKIDKPQIQIEEYRILKNNRINIYNYSLTISRLCMWLMENTPLQITTTTDYDHDLLIRNGGKDAP